MRRSLPIIVILALGVVVVLWWRPGGFDADAARVAARDRDLILITCDTTRADRLSCYGYTRETTPNIDRLAAEGVRFEQAYTATPITLPSHCTIFTGQDPPKHTVRNNGTYVLPEKIETLAEALQRSGRSTAAFISAPVLAASYGLDQGFDHYDDDLAGGLQETVFVMSTRRADETVARALAWMQSQDRAKPLFVWVHFFDPHAPYNPRERRFGDSISDRYDAEIVEMDAAIGTLRKEVEALRGEAIWTLLTDHGEGLSQPHGDHCEPGHGVFLYDELVRMPLILSGQGVFPEGLVVETVARQADVTPTLLDLLGLEIPTGLDGRSLLSALDTKEPRDREVYLESSLPQDDYGWSPQFALVVNRWKYVLSPIEELYDLSQDPGETRNLARSEPGRASSMRAALEDLARRRAGMEPERIVADGASLASLGYSSGKGLLGPGTNLPDPKTRMTIEFNIQLQLDVARELLRKQPQAGLDLLSKIVDRDETNGAALELLGWESLRLVPRLPAGTPPESLLRYSRRAFDLYLKHAPERPDGEFGLGKIEEVLGHPDRALALYEKVREAHPEYVLVLESLMVLHGRKQDFVKFHQIVSEILALDEHHVNARFQRISAYRRQNRVDEAFGEARVFRELHGNSEDPTITRFLPQFYDLLGDLHRQREEYAEAVSCYRQVPPASRAQLGTDAKLAECEKNISP